MRIFEKNKFESKHYEVNSLFKLSEIPKSKPEFNKFMINKLGFDLRNFGGVVYGLRDEKFKFYIGETTDLHSRLFNSTGHVNQVGNPYYFLDDINRFDLIILYVVENDELTKKTLLNLETLMCALFKSFWQYGGYNYTRFGKFNGSGGEIYYNPDTNVKIKLLDGEEVPDGFIKGIPEDEHMIWIHNISTNENSTIYPGQKLPDGWDYGRIYHGNDRKCIHNSELGIFNFIDVNDPIPDGWELGKGEGTSPIEGLSVYHDINTGRLKYFSEDDIIPDNFIKGKGFDTTGGMTKYHNPVTGEIRHFSPGDIIPDGWIKGQGFSTAQGKKWVYTYKGNNISLYTYQDMLDAYNEGIDDLRFGKPTYDNWKLDKYRNRNIISLEFIKSKLKGGQ